MREHVPNNQVRITGHESRLHKAALRTYKWAQLTSDTFHNPRTANWCNKVLCLKDVLSISSALLASGFRLRKTHQWLSVGVAVRGTCPTFLARRKQAQKLERLNNVGIGAQTGWKRALGLTRIVVPRLTIGPVAVSVSFESLSALFRKKALPDKNAKADWTTLESCIEYSES